MDFDLTMSVPANNLLRLLAADLPGYTHHAAPTRYKKFLQNSGTIKADHVCVAFKKKRNLPALLTVTAMAPMDQVPIAVWENRPLVTVGETCS